MIVDMMNLVVMGLQIDDFLEILMSKSKGRYVDGLYRTTIKKRWSIDASRGFSRQNLKIIWLF